MNSTAIGTIGTDDINLSDTFGGNQFFVAIDQDFINFGNFFADGVLGLGFSELGSGYLNFVDTLKAQGIIATAQFALYLSSEEEKLSSNIMIGEFDLNKYSEDGLVESIDINTHSGYWQVNLKSVFIDVHLTTDSKTAIFDIATSKILAPIKDAEAVHTYFKSNYNCNESFGTILCSCQYKNSTDNYPQMLVTLGTSSELSISPKNYFF